MRDFPVLTLRLRMPFDGTTSERNLITKLRKYRRVLTERNSLTYMPDFLSVAAGLITRRATGLYNVVRNVGASAGVAILTTMLARQTQAHQASLVERVTVWDPAVADRLGVLERAFAAAGADPHTAGQQALHRLYEEVQRQASMKAFVDDFRVLMWLFVAFVPAVWLMTRPVHHAPEEEPMAVVETA